MAIPIATFLLLTSTLLPAATANAQDLTITHTVQNNAKNPSNYNYFENNLRLWAEQNMPMITSFIRNQILCRKTQTHTQVILQVEDRLPPPNVRAYATGNTINMSVEFLRGPLFANDKDREAYFQETMYHEMTHVWQFLTGYGLQPHVRGLVEGMADYAAIKAGHTQYVRCCPTRQDRWDEGYGPTAYFLLYLEGAGYRGVVCNVNLMMQSGYDDQTFRFILKQRSPDELWNEYLDTLQNPPPPPRFPSDTTTTQM